MKHIVMLPVMLGLSSCFGAPRVPAVPATPDASTPQTVLDIWGIWATWAGGASMLAAGLALVGGIMFKFPPPKWAGFLFISGLTLIVSGRLLVWLEASLKPLALATLLVGIIIALRLLWVNRKDIEHSLDIDIDRDGKVGNDAC